MTADDFGRSHDLLLRFSKLKKYLSPLLVADGGDLVPTHDDSFSNPLKKGIKILGVDLSPSLHFCHL
jgi:hypothetical protein